MNQVSRACHKFEIDSEEKYRSIIQTSSDGFWITDTSGKFLDANDAYCNLVGYNHEELLRMYIQEIDVNGSLARILRHFRASPNQRNYHIEIRQRRKDGRHIDFEISATYSGKKRIEQIFVFAHDITRRKRNETIIRQSESKYRELADSITDGFAALDADLKYIYWNKTYEKTTGISSDLVMGKPFFNLFKKNSDTRKIALMYRKSLRTKQPEVFVNDFFMNNTKKVIENHIYPSKTGIVVLSKDITKKIILKEKLEEYTQRLEDLVKIRTEKLKTAERLATIGETAGMVGHDIRNPLQTITGELYLAKTEIEFLSDKESKTKLIESFSIIEEQLKYINKIVSDLTDYSKPLMLNIEEVNLEKVIAEILSRLSVPDDIEVKIIIRGLFPKMRTDLSCLKRILVNLITNAVQAMPKGGKLCINADWTDKIAIIKIADTGEGISEEAKTKIFKPLFTTKAKGQGLGLAVVKKLVDALSGIVTFESEIGKGSQFKVEIPIYSAL